jgi:nucleotide-binding universal stress UspA family protein
MTMFKTILVAVDGSDQAQKAVDVAADLAQKYDAQLLLLSVYKHVSALESTHTLVHSKDSVGPRNPTLRDLANEFVKKADERARERGATRIETHVKRGQPARVIVEFAKEKGADVIVMGSRGLGDIGGFLLGSVSHKVSSLAECTCITVK